MRALAQAVEPDCQARWPLLSVRLVPRTCSRAIFYGGNSFRHHLSTRKVAASDAEMVLPAALPSMGMALVRSGATSSRLLVKHRSVPLMGMAKLRCKQHDEVARV